MRDEALAEILGAHVATSEPVAELWHRVALGELSPDEAVAQVLAEHDDVGEDERAELERAKRVFAPLSEEQREAQLERLLARQAAERGAEDEDEEDEEADDTAQAVVLPMRSHRTRRWVVGLMAAAAAVVLTVWLIPPGSDLGRFPRGAELELDKATATMRGSEPQAEVPTFLLDGKIVIRLVPKDAVKGPVGAVAFAWDRSGQAQLLTLEPTVYDNGVIELDTTVEALGLGEGEWELVIAYGWAEALPKEWEELAELGAGGAERFEVLRKRLRVVKQL